MKMRFRRNAGSWVFDVGNIVFLLILSAFFLYPFLYVFSVSISDTQAVSLGKVTLWPVGFNAKAYAAIVHDPMMLRAYFNTILYSVTYALTVLLVTCLTAHPLTHRRFRGRKFFMVFFTLTMFVSGGIIPSYLLIKYVHLRNTMWALILPGALQAWYLILIKTNFEIVPLELEESALIDGSGQWRILFQIVIPLSKPILATIGLFALIAQWNSFFAPLLYLTDSEKAPLQLVLRSLIVRNMPISNRMSVDVINTLRNDQTIDLEGYYEQLKMAAIAVSIGPIVLVYPFLQKYFVKGVLVGSIKG